VETSSPFKPAKYQRAYITQVYLENCRSVASFSAIFCHQKHFRVEVMKASLFTEIILPFRTRIHKFADIVGDERPRARLLCRLDFPYKSKYHKRLFVIPCILSFRSRSTGFFLLKSIGWFLMPIT
jgi:hypothetical protein